MRKTFIDPTMGSGLAGFGPDDERARVALFWLQYVSLRQHEFGPIHAEWNRLVGIAEPADPRLASAAKLLHSCSALLDKAVGESEYLIRTVLTSTRESMAATAQVRDDSDQLAQTLAEPAARDGQPLAGLTDDVNRLLKQLRDFATDVGESPPEIEQW